MLLFLPKFTFTSEHGLSWILAPLGMADAFSSLHADSSGMTGGRDLVVDEVYHKAFVALDEAGTEAAAATAVVAKVVAIPPPHRGEGGPAVPVPHPRPRDGDDSVPGPGPQPDLVGGRQERSIDKSQHLQRSFRRPKGRPGRGDWI